MKNTKKKGFTIVELVIVIAVIAILSAILIPTFTNLVSKSKEAALQENLRNAYTVYAAETAESGAEDTLSQDKVYFKVETKDGNNNVTKTEYYHYDNAQGEFVVADITPTDSVVTDDPATGYYLVSEDTYNNYNAYYYYTHKGE